MSLTNRNIARSSTLFLGALLVLMTLLVSVPLTVITIMDKGGELGFETVGLAVLMPLCAYVLFGVSGLLRDSTLRRRLFVISHLVSLLLGFVYCIIFPVYPVYIVIAPMFFATLGILDKQNTIYYLIFMQTLGVAANVVLLFWEVDAGQTLPLIELLKR